MDDQASQTITILNSVRSGRGLALNWTPRGNLIRPAGAASGSPNGPEHSGIEASGERRGGLRALSLNSTPRCGAMGRTSRVHHVRSLRQEHHYNDSRIEAEGPIFDVK